MRDRFRMMRFGASGSFASFISTRANTAEKITNAQPEPKVRGSVHEIFPPRSKPKRRKKTVRTSEKDPEKSTRLIFTLKSAVGIWGRCRVRETESMAKSIAGT
jgi:hypothetical protein